MIEDESWMGPLQRVTSICRPGSIQYWRAEQSVSESSGRLELLSSLERECFPQPWSSLQLSAHLTNPSCVTFVCFQEMGDRLFSTRAIAYLLAQLIQPEAEILRMGVVADCRKSGVGRLLLESFIRQMHEHAFTDIILEFSSSNVAAKALYSGRGFMTEGQRRAYYADRDDAILARLKL